MCPYEEKWILEELEALLVGGLGHSRRQSTALDIERLWLVPFPAGSSGHAAWAVCEAPEAPTFGRPAVSR